MRPIRFAMALPALLALTPAHANPPAGKEEAIFVNPAEIKWSAAPPDLPKGAQIAVLQGDPAKKGVYALRLKLPDGYVIPPHWHTQAEQLTIVSGLFMLHMGDTLDVPAHDLGPGAFHSLPAKAHHAAKAKGETVVQVSGMGPFDIHYLNPSDDPRKTAGGTKKAM
jgi:hypothetical protein